MLSALWYLCRYWPWNVKTTWVTQSAVIPPYSHHFKQFWVEHHCVYALCHGIIFGLFEIQALRAGSLAHNLKSETSFRSEYGVIMLLDEVKCLCESEWYLIKILAREWKWTFYCLGIKKYNQIRAIQMKQWPILEHWCYGLLFLSFILSCTQQPLKARNKEALGRKSCFCSFCLRDVIITALSPKSDEHLHLIFNVWRGEMLND